MKFVRPLAGGVRQVCAAALLCIAMDVHAQNEEAIRVLETVRVLASAVNEDANDLAVSYSILEGRSLFERSQPTLGDTMSSLPGVSSDTFGGGASRPVIRGQGAPRVAVLADSALLFDASNVSPDHAITAEPLLIERIEVLRGPATLLYGSGAIGGVVNVLDKKIPHRLPTDRMEGSLGARASSGSGEKAGAFEVTVQASDHWALHAEAMARDANDYRAPGLDGSRAIGTFAASDDASVGASRITDRGFIGVAYSYRADRYGIAGHSHQYDSCHAHDDALHCDSHAQEEHEHRHEPVPEISLLSRRIDLRGQFDAPLAGVERIRVRASHTDYRHHELEEGEIATKFLTEGYEGRVEAQHATLGGLRGVVGVQLARTRSNVIGAEAFLPKVRSRTLGVFVVEHIELDDRWHFELGARQEWQKHEPLGDLHGGPALEDSATSLSAAAVWGFAPGYSLTLALTRSERLPHAQELYARGTHTATNTYECGLMPHQITCGGPENDARIETETARNVELALKKLTGALTFSVGAFRNDVEDYIYARTLDRFEDFRLIKYSQRNAEFKGFEAEATYRMSDGVSVTFFGDYVRAKLAGGGYLPRIPAARYGARLQARRGAFGGEIEFYRVNEQDNVAELESATPGYEMLNLTLTFGPHGSRYSAYLRGSNLLDEVAWNHASYLANVVPLPGLSVTAGFKLHF